MEITMLKNPDRRQKRLGRGIGSGKGGHTVGRGQKGQRSRGKIGLLFEGVKVKKSFLKRLPLRRGRGKFKASPKPVIIKLGQLNVFRTGTKVDITQLVKQGLVSEKQARKLGVKILSGGKLEKKLEIVVPISKKAAKEVS